MHTALALSALIAAAPCQWGDSDIPPLRLWDRIVVLQRAYVCPSTAQGTLSLSWVVGQGTASGETKAKVTPSGKWPQRGQIVDKLWPNKICDGVSRASGEKRIVGIGDEQRLSVVTPIKAKLLGTGDMAQLSWEGQVDFLCPACAEASGSIAIMEGRAQASRLSATTRISLRADATWWACAGTHTDLAMRFFSAKQNVENAIRPIYVIEHLERGLKRGDNEFSAELPTPNTALCQRLGQGTHALEWEVFGQGELMRLGGGGRSRIELTCP